MTPPPSILRVAADLQAAAYTTWPGDKDAVCAGNVYAKVYYIGGNTYISVRGTDDVRDWIGNVPVSSPVYWGNVHAGYWEMAERIHGWAVTNDFEGQLILTGHSLGGGVAMMLPLISPYIADQLSHIITFGSPKCVQGPYPFSDKLTRVVRRLDIVPDLPCWGSWQHVGRELYFTDDGLPCKRSTWDAISRRAIRFNELGQMPLAGEPPFATMAANAWRKVNQWHSCEGYSQCRFGGE